MSSIALPVASSREPGPPTRPGPGDRAPVGAGHLALVGCTASGKTALALALAERRPDVEVVSVDSMAVYRGMDVATAKPSAAERLRVPHHLVDVADPDEEYTVARFRAEALAAVAAIERRGHRALLVGGTGLYLRALVDDLQLPGRYPALAEELWAETADPAGLAAALG
ncbi:tRNA (adenosine(37)-N6)-dimethylallyltransferase, partial [Aciditerrimonas ferrireducens]